MKDIFDVKISNKANKDLSKIPMSIRIKLFAWIEDIGHRGLQEVRKIPGFHDEPLKGDRKGQRSIRLSRSYRAIYEIKNEKITFILVQEVNKHDY